MQKIEKITENINKFHINPEKEEKSFKQDPPKRSSLIKNTPYTIEKIVGNGTFGTVYQVL